MIKRVQHRKTLRLLIVDDSGLIRETLTSLCSLMPRLKVAGHAADGIEGMAAIREFKPDVVTLDIRMPRMNGIEVLQAIQAEKIDCKIIVLSAFTDEIYVKKCFELGAHYVFDKGTEFDQAMEVLRSL